MAVQVRSFFGIRIIRMGENGTPPRTQSKFVLTNFDWKELHCGIPGLPDDTIGGLLAMPCFSPSTALRGGVCFIKKIVICRARRLAVLLWKAPGDVSRLSISGPGFLFFPPTVPSRRCLLLPRPSESRAS